METGHLVASIYESIGDEEALAETIKKLVAFTHSGAAQFGFLDRSGRWLKASAFGQDSTGMNRYLKYHLHSDPRAQFALRFPGKFYNCSQMVGDVSAFERTALVEHLDYFEARWMLGAYFPVNPLYLGGLGFFRPRTEGQYDRLEIQRADRLLPHLQRAMDRHIQLGLLESQLSSLEAMANRLATPMLLVDRTGILRHANTAGHEALRRADHLFLRGDRVEPCNSRQAPQFAQLVAAAMAEQTTESTAMRLLDEKDGAAIVTIYPLRGLPGTLGMPQADAVVFVTYPDTERAVDALRLQKVFGLTPAETRLAEHLVSGQSLAEMAEQLHLSRETLKSQLRSLFDKTAARRQGELIALLRAAVSIALR